MSIPEPQRRALLRLLRATAEPDRVRVVVRPDRAADGYWFGGGNLAQDDDGGLWLVGRYRDAGDSRSGLAAGERGRALALLHADAGPDEGNLRFREVRRWSKTDLSRPGAPVLSIEGSALRRAPGGGWELFVSSEKARAYPPPWESYQKPGTGVWTIDRLHGPAPDRLEADSLEPVLASDRPESLHVKDPVPYAVGDAPALLFCSHPISWASSNTGLAVRSLPDGGWRTESRQLVPRGAVWDVAVTRATGALRVPRIGAFADAPPTEILFYDGAEAMRRLDPNPRAHARPRGWSCEELGGALVAPAGRPAAATRLSATEPLFVSPHGTGSSRYRSALLTERGLHVLWQQAQPDGSQPLVASYLPLAEVERLLGG